MATVEHAALVVLVSGAIAAGGATVDATAVPRAVGAQVAKAFCLVAGGDCLGPDGPQACVVRTDRRSRDAAGSLVVLRLRDGRSALVEQRSDGTVQVTITRSSGVGAAVLLGGKVRIAGREATAGGEAGGTGGLASARRFVVADVAAARRLVERLERSDVPVGGAAADAVRFLTGAGGDEDERSVAFEGAADAEASLRLLGLGAVARAAREVTLGVRVHRRTGTRTLLLGLDRTATAELAAPLAGLGFGLGVERAVELALDADGRPRTLTVRVTGDVRGDARLRGAQSSGGDRGEAEARLDLTDPVARELAGRLLHGDVRAAPALAAHARDTARLDVRRYATSHDERTRGAELGALGKLGLTVTDATDTARLVDAWGREPGLGWAPRLDCRPVA